MLAGVGGLVWFVGDKIDCGCLEEKAPRRLLIGVHLSSEYQQLPIFQCNYVTKQNALAPTPEVGSNN